MQSSPPDRGEGPDSANRPGKAPGGATGRDAERRNELIRYAGLSSQVVASIGIAVFVGMKVDKWLAVSFPIVSWGLPLLVIVGLIINLIKSSSRKNDGK